jgi:hypothetical protein
MVQGGMDLVRSGSISTGVALIKNKALKWHRSRWKCRSMSVK